MVNNKKMKGIKGTHTTVMDMTRHLLDVFYELVEVSPRYVSIWGVMSSNISTAEIINILKPIKEFLNTLENE